ncbi:MAG: hypothetical protein NVSMB62_26370 [Acidobacteriaceae bacterium]
MRIGIIAAVPLELKHVVRGWDGMRNVGRYIHGWTRVDAAGDTLVAVCAGMGAEAARRAFVAAEAGGRLDVVLSVGLAGATDSGWHVGQCGVLSEVIDARTGERFTLTGGERTLRIVSAATVADAREKKRLRSTYLAVMVDMEAATVARMAQQRGIPMSCIKVVSDEVDAVLPDVTPFVREGQIRMVPFVASVALQPRMWMPLVRLGTHSAKAVKVLGVEVNLFLLQKRWSRTERAGEIAT